MIIAGILQKQGQAERCDLLVSPSNPSVTGAIRG
jgi:hypothetical protein